LGIVEKKKKVVTRSRRSLVKDLERELAWSRFGLNLETRLGELMEVDHILQVFSDHLKECLPYDYLEIVLLPGTGGEDTPSDWVRNDTGYGGKLLRVLLSQEFIRGLRWRRHPQPIQVDGDPPFITNPDLLRIMNLQSGILVPLCQGTCAHGVIKLFFRQPTAFDADQQSWLTTIGAILYRALRRAAMFQKAQKLATIDGLTGLYNHRYFMEQLSKEFTRARRYRNWLSLIIVDIDYFKHYNDTNGHLAGDRVLKRVGRTIRQCVREMDLVARWGGEEFTLLLPEIDLQNAMVVAEKIRREIETQRFKNERKQPHGRLTISAGVADNASHLKNPKEMFNQADAALYRAKMEGRNRCAFAK